MIRGRCTEHAKELGADDGQIDIVEESPCHCVRAGVESVDIKVKVVSRDVLR